MAIRILQDGHLTREFLEAGGDRSLRALIKELFPKLKLGRDLADSLTDANIEKIEITFQEFQSAMEALVEKKNTTSYHIGVFSTGDFQYEDPVDKLESLKQRVKSTYKNTNSFSAPEFLQCTGDPSRGIDVIYIGEAIADVRVPDKDDVKTVDGKKFRMEAHMEQMVPVISHTKIGPTTGTLFVYTRSIKSDVRTRQEANLVGESIANHLNTKFFPIPGIASGIQRLFDLGELSVRQVDSKDENGTTSALNKKGKVDSESAQIIEDRLMKWDIQKGHLTLDDIPFQVDTRSAVFSFSSRTLREDAELLIQKILRA